MENLNVDALLVQLNEKSIRKGCDRLWARRNGDTPLTWLVRFVLKIFEMSLIENNDVFAMLPWALAIMYEHWTDAMRAEVVRAVAAFFPVGTEDAKITTFIVHSAALERNPINASRYFMQVEKSNMHVPEHEDAFLAHLESFVTPVMASGLFGALADIFVNSTIDLSPSRDDEPTSEDDEDEEPTSEDDEDESGSSTSTND
jgi:hypothetical protein